MKKAFFILFVGLLNFSLFAQDSIQKPTLLLRPYFENGIDFIRNDFLKQNYMTQSKYFWGFGLQIGHPETFKIIPYIQILFSTFAIEQNITKADSTLTTKQFTGGLILPLKKFDKIYFRARVGYCYSMIKESFYNINTNAQGFQIGFGFERKLIGNSRIYFDLLYNYQKTSKSQFRDFDMTKLSIGYVI